MGIYLTEVMDCRGSVIVSVGGQQPFVSSIKSQGFTLLPILRYTFIAV